MLWKTRKALESRALAAVRPAAAANLRAFALL
jgi:hypothetical protein